MGNFITISLFRLQVKPDDELWKIARQYQEKTASILDSKRFDGHLPFRHVSLENYEHAADINEPLCQWSNLGKIDSYFDQYKTLNILDFSLVCNSRESAHPCSYRGIMYTFRGRLKTTLWCVEPFLNAWEGKHMLKEMFTILDKHVSG
jgi:hypothetical protein